MIEQNKTNPDRFLNICRGYLFVLYVTIIPFRNVEDACPYKIGANLLIKTTPLRSRLLCYDRKLRDFGFFS